MGVGELGDRAQNRSPSLDFSSRHPVLCPIPVSHCLDRKQLSTPFILRGDPQITDPQHWIFADTPLNPASDMRGCLLKATLLPAAQLSALLLSLSPFVSQFLGGAGHPPPRSQPPSHGAPQQHLGGVGLLLSESEPRNSFCKQRKQQTYMKFLFFPACLSFILLRDLERQPGPGVKSFGVREPHPSRDESLALSPSL